MFNWMTAMLLPASCGRNDCPIHIAKILGTSQQAAKERPRTTIIAWCIILSYTMVMAQVKVYRVGRKKWLTDPKPHMQVPATIDPQD